MKSWFGDRRLLNKTGFHSTAAIVAEVQDTKSWENKEPKPYMRQPQYTFQFSDCSRTVSFDLNWDTEEGRENDLYKVDTMISVLREFRKGLVKEQARFVKREEQRLTLKDAVEYDDGDY